MRPNRDTQMMTHAFVAAERSTCVRRQVGCVLTREDGHILAIGYNGQYPGALHCNEGNPCPGWEAPSGTNLDGCEAIHAEQNALMLVPDVRQIYSCYSTVAPCMTCTKLLLNTGTKRILFAQDYTHPEAEALWQRAGRFWAKL